MILPRFNLFCLTFLLLIVTLTLTAFPALAEIYEVKMGADNGVLKFVPETLTIHPGDTINFVMNRLAPHNVVFNKGPENADLAALSSDKLLFSPGQTYSLTFPEDSPQGKYEYYCQPHRGAGMVAEILVE